jgi:hypothetical protein
MTSVGYLRLRTLGKDRGKGDPEGDEYRFAFHVERP